MCMCAEKRRKNERHNNDEATKSKHTHIYIPCGLFEINKTKQTEI